MSLPYNEDFNYSNGNNTPSAWKAQDQDDTSGTYHDIRKKSLRIVSGGSDKVEDYYTVYLNDITGDFTATTQVKSLTDTTSITKAGLIVQNSLGSTTNTAHIQVAASRDTGYLMMFDDDGDGSVDQTFSAAVGIAPPDVWLRVVRSGNTFSGFYSTDNSTWTLLGIVASSKAESELDVGLFGFSGQFWWSSSWWPEISVAGFDNFSIIGSAATFTYHEDSDGDGYGNPSVSITSTSATPPSGYVTDNTDCDDTDANTYPGATEICDGKDNNCDGTIDEGLSTNTYYRDADGDGYGTIIDTHQGCSPNPGYVTTPGDCNDNNILINPGASDICGNNIDEDCSGGDAACFSDTICEPISDTPLSVTVGGSAGIIMFILDDSGSMDWSVMCAEDEGRFNGLADYTANYSRPRWKSQYHGYNRIYYNPGTTYKPWAASKSRTFSDATFTNALKHPLGYYCWALSHETSGNTISLTRTFDSYGGIDVTFGHYYVVSTTDSQPYLVDLGIKSSAPVYYKVTQSSGGASDNYRSVKSLTKVIDSGVPSDVAITGTFTEARSNFANWFTYHRTREVATKAALGFALQDLSGVKVGIHTFNHSVTRPATLITTAADVEDFLDYVYQVDRDGPTPMRLALEDVGQYLDAQDSNNGGIGTNPFDTSANGGDCQQAFAILMTDGYGNGGSPSVGNADADNNSKWDGPEFYGKNSNRLPDVAMHYYERDLVTALADKVPVQDPDYEAPHQRMVTYTVSFGIEGDYDQADYPNCPPAHPDNAIDCPPWPSGGTNEAKVDELWHAAVNGRGQYISTGTPQELSDAINSVLNDITRRTGTAASVAVSSEKLDTGLVIYQGFFDSGDWSGNLEAYDVNASGVVNLSAKWSAKTQLNAANWDTGRTILTRNDATETTKAFRYGNLSGTQKSNVTENQVDYIRGDNSLEEVRGGAFRNRNSKLADITHSSPVLHNGVVYVGANDGMFHAFDAANGNELFAYVPSFVYPNLGEYTSPNYGHKFYADGTATARTVPTSTSSQDWVVSGLRKGGRGLFGINVTSPKTISETALPTIWEYPTLAVPDDDMGYTYGEVTIAQGNDSSAGDQLIFTSNGYDSPNGHAVLLILKLDGTLFKKIDTGVGSSTPGNCNGLSDPLVVDLTDDGKADVVYAGDLLGNLWKFDISDPSKSNWKVAYETGGVSKPLFTAKNSSGQTQPITSKPAAMFHCNPTKKGTILVFGTGRMLSDGDLDNTNTQTIYGIWDWQEEWARNGYSDTTPYHMGTFNTPSGTPSMRTLSNIDGNNAFPATVDLTLLQQTQVSSSDDWRYTSNNAIDWFEVDTWKNAKSAGTSYTGGVHLGWYLNLPDSKERVITKTQIRDGKAYIVSIIPEPAPCASGGTTVGSILNACNGGQLQDPQWDTNGDGVVDANDNSASGKKFDDDIYYAPAIIEDKLFFTKDRVENTTDEIKGLFYWRIKE
ncbi:hypothetical protein DSLASN_27820 [Desulfoluna limicola]|uniref:VWFA domain-containing protein n=1 Tax=Desulfoluna limicola TaxID=2810562 RepID=A0ABM7PHT4_9BACT|nr:hypothetical protein DSLASN_27820 [Desulfoluna limicola]